jgi:hypothetical protein
VILRDNVIFERGARGLRDGETERGREAERERLREGEIGNNSMFNCSIVQLFKCFQVQFGVIDHQN